ncbi:MAG: nucleotide sugar dehydrogenase, partial [Bacteroidota bacterium]
MRSIQESKIAVIGLGYVGLPLAVEFAKKYEVTGFDISSERVEALKNHNDHTREVSPEELQGTKRITYTDNEEALKDIDIYIVTVPTPVDEYKKPNLTPLRSASKTVGKYLKKNAIVIYESTVYPGCTEEVCVPELEETSGLVFNKDFYCGYSPERINPGDKKRKIATIVKVTSGSTPEIATVIDDLYKQIITAGTHKAPSIKVAEAAKVI